MSGTVVLGLMSSDLDLVTSASAIASSLGNIGPALGAVGPTGNFLAIPDAGRWLLSFWMIAGRLEIFPLVLLFTRNLWRTVEVPRSRYLYHVVDANRYSRSRPGRRRLGS